MLGKRRGLVLSTGADSAQRKTRRKGKREEINGLHSPWLDSYWILMLLLPRALSCHRGMLLPVSTASG
jgi:hypothetical protein